MLKALGLATAAATGGYIFYRQADVTTQFELLSAMGPAVRMLDAETAHMIGIESAKRGLFPKETRPSPEILRTTVWGREFSNPIGLAAGFDKNAEVIEPLMGLGFGFVEVGSITPKPQPGNPKPRAFRIKDLRAIINRYGFNSLGADAVQDNLLMWEKKSRENPGMRGMLGVNLGKNKSSNDAATDYMIGITKLGTFADYLVINVSSPNTPGLRSLQGRKELDQLVGQVKTTRDRMRWGPQGAPPLLVKIAPDLTEQDKQDIAAVVLKHKLDGLVISNTTVSRPGAVAAYPESLEAGGLSGPPLMELSTQVLADMYHLTKGKVPIIGCGGVSSGDDAYRKVRAGASLVQIYTALAYEGPAVVPHIKARLAQLLMNDGFKSVGEAVGADHRKGGVFHHR
mmetsp:Transcript_9229/g.16241  ORF Transcript_9229/g.16241 Transcript_9229/m.16241 type:complete len:398 (+) Transcript_9229:23-1216(+)|eukprot:CAMPEP_0119103294 /NCGR_PEP_ID=MMETSP1180-20130426/1753_1 /TAXON_ID=3052 ORGANISM="Chlamydomonas cf sp, Strain CCMP681" /NCGR_SAMPLE_ID=MMETSP1180 /ASSEMBLY_ACC=CAM_ASM_000741 /LENGTH=397 /DNA_ID=CAMNT_0007087749 /DNA_START=21 /DNA_END=1214 /DNA_ORIENTATION=+